MILRIDWMTANRLHCFPFDDHDGSTTTRRILSRVEKLAASGKAIPFPLPEVDLPMDPVFFDEDYYGAFVRNGGKTPAVNMPLIQGLLQRYPESGKLRNSHFGCSATDANGKPLVTLKDYSLPGPGMTKADKMSDRVFKLLGIYRRW